MVLYLPILKIIILQNNARSHRLLLKIDLSERVSKCLHIVSIPTRVGYWDTYTMYIV